MLKNQQVKRLEYWVLTHGSSDHIELTWILDILQVTYNKKMGIHLGNPSEKAFTPSPTYNEFGYNENLVITKSLTATSTH